MSNVTDEMLTTKLILPGANEAKSQQPDKEVCYDYAMSDGDPYDEFKCNCMAANCRGKITCDDWRNPELWERYQGYFSPYLQRRIDRLREDDASYSAT